jgi:two-component system alkaline phosphatase synthesis response regulator PhoP
MERPEDKTILVVDDEPDVRNYLQMILEDAGFRVVTAGDGQEALELIRHDRPDFISLDLIMPRKSGHKLLFELKRDRELARIPVLIVTAHARDELGKKALQEVLDSRVMSGPGTYLEKPVNPNSYVRAIQRALGIETPPEAEKKGDLKDELQKSLRGASVEAMREALEMLRKAKMGPSGATAADDERPEVKRSEES